jgi:hypothetical protein
MAPSKIYYARDLGRCNILLSLHFSKHVRWPKIQRGKKKLTPLKEAALTVASSSEYRTAANIFFSLIKQPPTFTVQLS